MYDVRFRYRQEKQKCKIIKIDNYYEVTPVNVQFGIASGQSAVIYSDDKCLGGGIIKWYSKQGGKNAKKET